ncbi:MAG: hypothetical protein Kow0099_22620 [Candidatus Abyssubacteria bacterium]
MNDTIKILGLSLLCVTFPGCASVGPRTVAHDRFDYVNTISDSWKDQMLLNMVMLRYGDAPVFLDVSSIINSYSVETTVDGGLSWSFPPDSESQNLGASATYADRPTITYSPLSGARFARSLMAPIPTTAILNLINAGYPVDLILRLCVSSINGIQNRYGGAARAHAADPEFYLLIERMRKIQQLGFVGFRIQKTDAGDVVLMILGETQREEVQKDSDEIRRILRLNPDSREFNVVYSSVPRNDKEVALLTRSMLEILIDMAANVTVPDTHVAEGRVNATFSETTADGVPIMPLIRFHNSAEKPSDAFVSVPYRGHWFWIDDKDIRSKTIFSFLMFAFALTETGGETAAPVVTIPIR